MPYSLVSAATLGFDLVRLPAGREVAGVLLAGMDAVLNTHSLPAHALMARLKGIGVRTFCGLHLVERTPWGNPLGTAHTALAYEHAYD